ncbi:MAG TPA: lysylphosphatidylglycerol synthase transmembrane domain-containing protein [Geobacteraceae bacterium]|nr:lysylphosphatidylglycerol synthase transmembrane domain-containing protein [Geobacteraceae bacterium]
MKKHKFNWQLWIGIGVSLFFLYVLFRKIDLHRLFAAFAEMDYRYLLPAVIATLIGYYVRAVRWKYLLMPLKDTGMKNLFTSTVIGYMANNLFPARLGELIRAYVLGEKERMEKSSVFATLVLDRLFDGFTVLILLIFTLLRLRFPENMSWAQKSLQYGGSATLAFYILVIFFLFILKIFSSWAISFLGRILNPFPDRIRNKVLDIAGSFVEGIRVSSRPADIFALFLTSVIMWALSVWTVDLTLRAFGIELPITAAMFILILLVFAVMVPASPGFVGTYHAACVYGLMAFNLPKEKALSVALTAHAINFFPVTILGLFYVMRDRISLRDAEEKSLKRGDVVEKI